MLCCITVFLCVCSLCFGSRIETNSNDELHDVWYSDYEDSQVETSAVHFKINSSWGIDPKMAKNHIQQWLTNMWNVDLPISIRLPVVASITITVLVLILLIWLLIFCQTGWGCCCFKFVSSVICQPEKVENELKGKVSKLIPGGIYDTDGNVIAVYQQSAKETEIFRDILDRFRRL